ncbi:MAG: 16S rRNA (uracil(1498)-N(3))-methyltransferase [Armatimonadetes bacterium]|nr:16S rRNA (uracil(1498)-N(3))-methyltransferase [Armatimonadota bacterium]
MALHRLHRFLVTPGHVQGDRLRLAGPEARHAAVVLRLRAGDHLLAFDGRTTEYLVEVERCGPAEVTGRILEARPAGGTLAVHLTLVQGLAKGAKMDAIVRMGTELGVAAFIPVAAARSVARAEAAGRVERWRRIAREASKQAHRTAIPEVHEICSFEEALRQIAGCDLCLMPWEEERGQTIGQALAGRRAAARVALIIGPEGGFAAEEVAQAKAAGVTTVSLGPLIFRTETAGPAAVAMVMYEFLLRPGES